MDQMSGWMDFLVTDLGGEDVILGLPWLREANPSIDWGKGLLQVRGRSDRIYDNDDFWATGEDVKAGATQEEEEGPLLTQVKIKANQKQQREWRREGVIEELEDEVWCAAGVTYSQQIAEAMNTKKEKKSFEQAVPLEYQDFHKVFSEEESERLPN